MTKTVTLERNDDVAVIRVDNPPVNALSASVRTGLCEAMSVAGQDERVRAILLLCAGRTFIAGADIREFGRPPEGRSLFEAHEALENSDKPVVAAIHGTALGGGLETALCCHFRVALEDARFGLPEVKLGLLPGAGGTQRLPRVVGVEKALEMMVSGEPVDCAFALASGLVDECVEDLLEGGLAFARRVLAEGRALRKLRDRDELLCEAREDAGLIPRFRGRVARKTRGFEAPEAIIQCVEDALALPFEDAIRHERERFAKLVTGEQSVAQRGYFFAERRAARIDDVPKDTPLRPVERVGIVGAGTMGGGIAMNFLNAGIPVTIVEREEAALERGVAVMRRTYERSVRRGRMAAEAVEARMALLTSTLEFDALAGSDLVIEAVFEEMSLKKRVFSHLDSIAKAEAILASNTSGLDLNEIAAATARPESVIGLHFFSPANVMKLIEVIRGEATARDVLATSMALARRIGKVAVVAGVCRGFIGNRMLAQRGVQAQKMIFEGPMPWDVDRVLYEFGFPMGPFEMADLAGLDIGWNPKTSRGETLRDRLCELGRRGQKTGAGYYDYDPETRARSPEPRVAELIESMSAERGCTRREFGDEEILQRLIYPMINEGARILEEGIAQRASDIDVVWVNGYGWPVYRGGPMHYADCVGLERVRVALESFRDGDADEFWRPAPLIEKLVAEGRGFRDL